MNDGATGIKDEAHGYTVGWITAALEQVAATRPVGAPIHVYPENTTGRRVTNHIKLWTPEGRYRVTVEVIDDA